MTEACKDTNIASNSELNRQFNWFYANFLPKVQVASDEFFSNLFYIHLASVSKNVNILFSGDDYFVTKIRVDKQHDVFVRCSETAINLILEEVLGKGATKFKLSNITELEAKIVTSFNDYIYGSLLPLMLNPPPANQKRKNFDMIHLTFFLRGKNLENDGGKLIVSLPVVLLNPQEIASEGEKFDVSDFKNSEVEVNIKVGTTKFALKDLKSIEKEDIVVFENSSLQKMRVVYGGYEKDFRLTPNPGLILQVDNNDGGDNMEENSLPQNLWDNIQVEMGAEFDKVKITLGELKNIEQGLVLDLSSVYGNKISLIVENKKIAKGELVIINDRYGVRIEEVYSSSPAQVSNDNAHQEIQHSTSGDFEYHDAAPQQVSEEEEKPEEEFDYSDFELDDEDI